MLLLLHVTGLGVRVGVLTVEYPACCGGLGDMLKRPIGCAALVNYSFIHEVGTDIPRVEDNSLFCRHMGGSEKYLLKGIEFNS